MKKVFIFLVVLFILGIIVYQNWSIRLLKFLSLNTGSSQISLKLNSFNTVRTFKNGIYLGDLADAIYGTIQVKTIVQNGKITDVQFLQYPSDRSRSVAINTPAMPNLKQEAIQAQSANVDIVSGATATSQTFVRSLASALSQAK